MAGNVSRTPSDGDLVAQAARAIPAEVYLGPDGKAVRPAVPAHATVRHLQALDLRPGMRVLEIGTGSGYSAALMGHIVGPGGHVLTVDADEELSRRAGAPFAEHGHRADAAVGNGLLGHPGGAPYDRIGVRATPAAIPAAIPAAWLDQLARTGRSSPGASSPTCPARTRWRTSSRCPAARASRCTPAGIHPLARPPSDPR